MQSPQVLLVLSVTLSTLALPILSSISLLYGIVFLISDWILWGKGSILAALFSCGGWFSFFLLLVCRFGYNWGDWWRVLFCSVNLGQRDKLKAYVLESHKPNTISFSSTRYISLQSSCLPFFVKYVSSLVLEWICSTLVRQKGQNISFLLIMLLLPNPRLIWLCLLDLPGFTRSVYKRDHALITPESHVLSPLPEWYFWLAFESSGRKLCSCFLV